MSRAPVRDMVKNIPGFEDEQSRVIAARSTRPTASCASSTATSPTARRRAATSSPTRWRWLAALKDWHARASWRAHPRLVLMGDFNIAPEDRDSHDPVGLAGHDPPHRRGARRTSRQLCGLGLHDSLPAARAAARRATAGGTTASSRSTRTEGLRIDHILVSEALRRR